MDTRNIKQKNHAGSKLIQGTVGDFNSHSSQQVEHSFLQINKHIYFCFVNVWLSLHRSRETQHFVVIFLLLGNYKQNYGQYVFFFPGNNMSGFDTINIQSNTQKIFCRSVCSSHKVSRRLTLAGEVCSMQNAWSCSSSPSYITSTHKAL